ncbi:MAG: DsbA family protein [Candidatus Altiarchaeota archaeon]
MPACLRCGAEISLAASYCKACGAQTNDAADPAPENINVHIILVLGIIIISSLIIWLGAPESIEEGLPAAHPDPASSSTAAPPRIPVIILNDRRCLACDTRRFEQPLLEILPGASFLRLDVDSPDGDGLYNASGVRYLPAVLFEPGIKAHKNHSVLERYLSEAGPYLSLNVESSWDPYCDATYLHCIEERCYGRPSCRREMKGRLELFVMSRCPYGIMALDAMKEVLPALEGVDFRVNYIADYVGGFSSLHGQDEVDDDLRGICAFKNYPDNHKYMDYIWCRNADMDGDWRNCATASGMDADLVGKCAEGEEGKGLLQRNLKLAKDLKVAGSPTWYVNNKYPFNAVTAEAVKAGYCAYNPGFAGCETNLTSVPGDAPAACVT